MCCLLYILADGSYVWKLIVGRESLQLRIVGRESLHVLINEGLSFLGEYPDNDLVDHRIH